jgi:hypothetical protein
MCVSEGGEQGGGGPHQRQVDVGNQLAGNGDGPARYSTGPSPKQRIINKTLLTKNLLTSRSGFAPKC